MMCFYKMERIDCTGTCLVSSYSYLIDLATDAGSSLVRTLIMCFLFLLIEFKV